MPYPSLHCDLRALPEGDLPRGCAYRTPDRAVYAFGPTGVGQRTEDRDPAGEDLGRGEHELLAVGLSADDCDRLREAWRSEDSLDGARSAQRAYLHAVAPDRARALSALLRGARRSEPPPGSVSCVSAAATGVVVRLPDGTGWWGTSDLESDRSGWSWYGPRSVSLVWAHGLSDGQCRRLLAAVAAAVDRARQGSPTWQEVQQVGRRAALAWLRAEDLA